MAPYDPNCSLTVLVHFRKKCPRECSPYSFIQRVAFITWLQIKSKTHSVTPKSFILTEGMSSSLYLPLGKLNFSHVIQIPSNSTKNRFGSDGSCSRFIGSFRRFSQGVLPMWVDTSQYGLWQMRSGLCTVMLRDDGMCIGHWTTCIDIEIRTLSQESFIECAVNCAGNNFLRDPAI